MDVGLTGKLTSAFNVKRRLQRYLHDDASNATTKMADNIVGTPALEYTTSPSITNSTELNALASLQSQITLYSVTCWKFGNSAYIV